MNKETFCSYPFNSFFLGADGGVKFCCASRINLGDINEEPIEDILHNEISTEIRTAILNGKWHKENCGLCYELETQMSGNSDRLPSVRDYYETLKDKIHADYFEPAVVDMRWSNTCNLSCNYCYEYFSSRWAQLKGLKVNTNKTEAEQQVFDFLSKYKDIIEKVNLLGGEPLLQKQNNELLDLLPEKGYYVLTNLSTIIENNSIFNKLTKMPNVGWGVSFETIGDKFEYVREGAKWDRFVSNLRHLHKETNKKINAHSLYCMYSGFDLVDFCSFVVDEGYFDRVYWQVLTNPTIGLNIFAQEKEIKLAALKELDRCIEKFEDEAVVNSPLLKQIRQELITNLEEPTGLDNSAWKGSERINYNAQLEFYKFLDDIEQKYMPNKSKKFEELWPNILEFYPREDR